MMKHIIILMALSAVITTAESQTKIKDKELQLYVTGGLKILQPKYLGHTVNISPASVPTIGGGALWQVKGLQMGGEFNYTDGKKNTSEFGTIFTGINFNLIGGYSWNLTQKVRCNVQSGFGYSLYHLSLTDKLYNSSPDLNTAIYHNMIYTVPASVMLQWVNDNGTLIGLRAGYNFNVMPNEWRYIKGSSTETFTTGTDGFYFQLVFGGLIKRS